jgi:hypothetical protein
MTSQWRLNPVPAASSTPGLERLALVADMGVNVLAGTGN